jgi:hypothetical protein
VAQDKVVSQHVRSNRGKHSTLSTPIKVVGVPAEILILALNITSDTDGQPADQTTAYVLRKPKVHYRVHNSPKLGPFAVRLSPVHKPTRYFLKNNFSSLDRIRD